MILVRVKSIPLLLIQEVRKKLFVFLSTKSYIWTLFKSVVSNLLYANEHCVLRTGFLFTLYLFRFILDV